MPNDWLKMGFDYYKRTVLLGIFDEGQADKQINEGIAHVSLSLPLV